MIPYMAQRNISHHKNITENTLAVHYDSRRNITEIYSHVSLWGKPHLRDTLVFIGWWSIIWPIPVFIYRVYIFTQCTHIPILTVPRVCFFRSLTDPSRCHYNKTTELSGNYHNVTYTALMHLIIAIFWCHYTCIV